VGVAVVATILYPIGVPLAFLFILIRSRHHLNSPPVLVSLGFLYEAFFRSTWWFELLDMVYKLFLTSVVIFLPPLVQLPIAMIVCSGFTMVLLAKQPYIRIRNDQLHLLAQAEIFLLLLTGYVLKSEETSLTGVVDILLSILLIGLTILIAVTFFLQLLFSIRAVYYAHRKKKLEKQLARVEDSEPEKLSNVDKSRSDPQSMGGEDGVEAQPKSPPVDETFSVEDTNNY